MITAALLNIGFEGFYEDAGILRAYIAEDDFSVAAVSDLDIIRKTGIKYEYRQVEAKNWNEEWEKNFSPVVLGDVCLVRAPFHPSSGNYPCELVIEPKMAFGTGHHPTTAMIAEYLLVTDLRGISLIDMGCGSGILGILAFKRGAANVLMADTDPDAVKNTVENIAVNNAHQCNVQPGGEDILEGRQVDMITANISKPVLISQMGSYFRALKPGGRLIISGILMSETSTVADKALSEGFSLNHTIGKGEWTMCVLGKPETNQAGI